MLIRIFVALTIVAYSRQEDAAENRTATTTTTTQAQTSFSCEGRVTGYYADLETGCRTYHYCNANQQYTYECPNNTLFQQRIFICNHWYLVDCGSSEQFYNANLLIGQRDKPFVGEEDAPLPPANPVPYPTTQRYEAKETTDYSDEASFPVEDAIDIQRVATTPASASTRVASRDGRAKDDDDDDFIRLKFADPRRLFYIPNENNAVEAISVGFREFVIPREVKEEVMQFKVGEEGARDFQCPKFCDVRYIRPGSCHPCITIK